MIRLKQLPNARPGEEVVLFLRRHWIDLLRIFGFVAFLLFIPLFFGAALMYVEAPILHHPIYAPLLTSILGGYLLIVVLVTLTELTDYWLDVWIVTNERIINSEQLGLFNRVVSEVYLRQIQDVTSEQKGFLNTFLTFGNVFVQTAAERERFMFKNIDNPDDVKIRIVELTSACKSKHRHATEEIGEDHSEQS